MFKDCSHSRHWAAASTGHSTLMVLSIWRTSTRITGAPARVLRLLPIRRDHQPPSLAALWQCVALRVLGTMALVLLILVTYGTISSRNDEWVRPEIENAVADSLSLL